MPSKILPLFLGLGVWLVLPLQAQEARRITLEGADGAPAPTEEIDKSGMTVIQKVETPVLELYPAAAKPSTHGTIMISPGGGYKILSINKEGRDVAKMLNAAGWDAAVLLYPVSAGPDTRTLALEAAGKAWTLLQKRGGEFGLSTAKTGAMGFSAGGHLTVRLAHEMVASGPAPAFLVLMYPAYLEKDGKLLDEADPVNIPTFLYVGDKDKNYYPSSEAYAAACKEKAVHCDYTVAPNVGHGFGLTTQLPEGARDWPDKLKTFLASVAQP